MSSTSFASKITRLPRAFDQDRGAEAAAFVPDLTGQTRDLIIGAGGSAPYLHGLIGREADWITLALNDPDAALTSELTRIEALAPDTQITALNAELRRAKRRVALLAGLCDLAGVWPLHQVTGALSDLADHTTHTALRAHVAREIERGKLPGQTQDDVESCAGMVALAMGKHGAGELNYSSDIDLICLFDETRFDPVDRMDARAGFIRATRKAMASLSELTADGYVFRTDLRLRPDPSVTPVCFAMDAAERYYESVGRTWERAAYIKARTAAGDLVAGQQFLDTLTPFVWRKHLDFAAIQETHDMRLKIRKHKGLGGALKLEDHNIKLGLGGIREIEFFAQTRQLIAGGRDKDLRMRGTCDALRGLADKSWIEHDICDILTADYTAHREVEHRLQMLRDQQTHSLPSTPDEFDRLAYLMGMDTEAMRADILQRCARVHEVTEGFFAPSEVQAPEIDQSDELREITSRWQSYPALRSERAQEIFDRLKRDILIRIQAQDRPLEVAANLDGFLRGLPAGVQLFALFEANPQLIDLILDIVATAPHLGRYLSRNSGVLDAVIGGAFFAPWPGYDALRVELAQTLAKSEDYELALDNSRRWAKEWHFRIGVHQLRGLISADEAGQQYCDLASASIAALYDVVVDAFAQKHGVPPGRGALVLGMGSLGAGRLTAASDLDMIVIYDAGGVEYSDGKRPLASRTYYARLTQAMITAVTAQTAQGRLYEVDMRLRPSGKQGPVATSFDSFTAYQQNEAWVWEHLALTRARVVVGAPDLSAAVEQFRTSLLQTRHDEAAIRFETNDMRRRLAEAKPGTPWDPKSGAGRMMDIELVAEAAALITGCPAQDVYTQLQSGRDFGWLTQDEHDVLRTTYKLTWRLQSAARLLTGDKLDPAAIGTDGRAFLMRSTETDSIEALSIQIAQASAAAADVLDRVLARPAVSS
ncbi:MULTISPECIES: glutamine-synthetase adenylyltransferase [Pacificibacter]|uniref:[protein-PII] uridylyltransferase family protein n=1 Tax=Pacificibacter TaxID=1042323 RepID=UPI001C09D546|nr:MULTISPECIES: glutamine-synthetase adenylyltransferase [Pacificibacter]MBU2936246.1 glutamine-synthetase adenylyltransferase [Pacificibacter marinus]MDO6616715.1 glutamine-synthetase adenylyltransferase [Pacificibacter sp. 1_MG-2023]